MFLPQHNIRIRQAEQEPQLPQDDIVTEARVVVAVVTSMTVVVCSARLFVRHFVVNKFGLDDVMILTCGFATLTISITFYGGGEHLWNVPAENLTTILKVTLVLSRLDNLLIFLMRTFPDTYIQLTCKGLMVFLALFAVISEIPVIFYCQPVRAFWDTAQEGAKCWSRDVLFGVLLSQGVIMFVTDVIILLLPIRPLWRLRLPLRERIPLVGLFALGGFACAASIVRFGTLTYTIDEVDFTHSLVYCAIWMNLEFGFGLMAGSLPSLRVLPGIRVFLGYLWRNPGSNGETG
ncbi:hypothetical protein BZA05DRAFT_423113, partial [Tricharina praecox]|uniref:uncharacterized protein n=1 Tax=Tricharina praecox TaxID=43433 RepID=UPI002220E374